MSLESFHPKQEHGFTLLEILISASILVVGILAIAMTMLVSGSRRMEAEVD